MTDWFQTGQSVPSAEVASLRELLAVNATSTQLETLAALAEPEAIRQFSRVVIGSRYAAERLCREPSLLLALVEAPLTRLHLPETPDESIELEGFDRWLREHRHRAMCAIIWRDLNRLVTLEQTTAALTELAEWALQCGLEWHYRALTEQLGEPCDPQGALQPFYVIGLGKLGAWELNLSSDVDLMFAYPTAGDTVGGPAPLSNQEFFARLGQQLIKSLDAPTRDGFVFRVDMRLRPYGTSGALASSFAALEGYYQTQGREWERFAMIKARIVARVGGRAGTSEYYAGELMQLLNRFSYRRYVDFSAIDALRNLKQLINREVTRRRLQNNIKLGRGGIREVEFIAQAFQLIRGGRDTELQERRVLKVLQLLGSMHCLPADVARGLAEAYEFLRNLEHAIQAQNDEQTQNLPQDETAQKRLAHALGLPDYATLGQLLEGHRRYISTQFQAVIAEPDRDRSDAPGDLQKSWLALWAGLVTDSPWVIAHLRKEGFDEPEQCRKLLRDFLTHPRVLAMDGTGRKRLDDFMPRALAALAGVASPLVVLTRLLELLKAIVRRSAYLLLLTENPGALAQLVKLIDGSPWIADELTAHPALLDELLDPATLFHVPSSADLHQELRQTLLRIPADDLEQQMEGLRYFRSSHALRVAACEITERLPLMRVSDYLTELAEVILDCVLQLAWREMTSRHGYPDGEVREMPKFVIIGYGKLGGIELSHGSDLDLVFIHDATAQGETSGDALGGRVLDNVTFYVRLGQKVIHILNTFTPGGQLYEVDMRLRPSGHSGLLVSSFAAFERYQFNDAWTWEHQALVRARPIAGDAQLTARFVQLRHQVLGRERELSKLRQEVVEMRRKMRTQLGSKSKALAEGQFALKQDAGGIVDIEFMVQYAVLAWAHAFPALAQYTDNIRILGLLEESGQLGADDVAQLIEAYKTFRSLGHRLVLQQRSAVVDIDSVSSQRATVLRVWQQLLSEDL